MTTFFGQNLVWWAGILAGCSFLLLISTASIKQFNFPFFLRIRPFVKTLHHWFGWITAGLLVIHVTLAIAGFNFGLFL